ncbi:MAG TPA: peptidyl-prolyl cis-trans isomerase [Sphingomicrobium sp.]|jgi:peptidyl-prolyl cis-trans isomerase D|nr:peptidyl-prolyl cis-trans isomerase [Sphingomicrobium sp.]
MLTSLRRLQNTKVGTIIVAVFFILILIGFASTGVTNFGSGNIGFGMTSSTLAKIGSEQVSEQDMSQAMQRRLQQVRQERPDADYSTIAGDFEALLGEIMDEKTILAFAEKYHFPLSKRLVDAEIAQIPQTKGLNGQFSEQAYQAFLAQQRLTDPQVHEVLAGGLLEKYMLTPVAANARVSVGMATPYASMLLEAREGEAAAIPLGAFRAGLKPTDSDLQQFYSANRNRYMVPEHRVIRIARIGPQQVASITASDNDVSDYYNAHKADYSARETRSISQAVIQDQATANQIAARAKGGASISAAAAPAGPNAAVTSLANQSQSAYAGVAGDKAATTIFGASSGSVVGPIRTDFGWLVAKVDSVNTVGGKSLDQARSEISSKITADKRKSAIEDMVDKIQDAVDNGSNFTEATSQAKLTVTTTPLIAADGTAPSDPNFKLPPELAPALKTGFQIEPNDPPEVVTLPNNQGYAVVSPGQIVQQAPAPLASVRNQVASDWTDNKALDHARSVAMQIESKVDHGTALAQAMKESGAALPPVQPLATRRIQIAMARGPVPAPVKMLFALAQGKSRMFPDPQGRGFFIVKVDKITPGNALLQPSLIGQMQGELQQGLSEDYGQEFLAAMRKELGAKRNEAAIQGFKSRLLSSGG